MGVPDQHRAGAEQEIDIFLAASSQTRPPRPSRITMSPGKLPKVPPGRTRFAFSISPSSKSRSAVPLTTRLRRGETPLGDDVALGQQKYCRPLHQPARRRIERFPPVHRHAVVPHHEIADLPPVPINEFRPRGETVDFVEQIRAGGLVHSIHPDRRRGIEVQRLCAGHRVPMDERMKHRRRLAFRFRRDHPVDPLIAGQPFDIAEYALPAFDRVLEPTGHCRIGGGQIDPGCRAPLRGQFKRVEGGSGRRVHHVGLVGMPLQFAVAEPADRFSLPVLQVRNQADFRDDGGGPLGPDDPLERSEKRAEISQFTLGERLPAKDQHRVVRP